MLKLKRLTIHKHPRVRPGTELVFNDGFNVLLGVNGSGKTTLLELLVQVLNGRFESLAEHEFHLSYLCEGVGARCSVDVRSSPGSLQKDPQARPLVSWTMQLDLHGGERITIAGEHDRVVTTYKGKTTTSVQPTDFDFPLSAVASGQLRELDSDNGELQARIHEFSTWNLARFDEATRWFDDGIAASEFVFFELGKGRIEPAIDDFLPPIVGRALADQARLGEQHDDFKLDDRQVEFLDQTCKALGFTSAMMQLELLRREQLDEPDAWSWYLGQLRFRFVKEDGTRLRHDQLSFGQRRLFAFLYYAAIHRAVIVADELTNGLHHAMIRLCLDVIGGRQAFLATQNPLLLDNLAFESAEEVRRTFILCATEREGGRERMVWRNMSIDEAENFYRDYKVGISHVNDILRSWGLW
ncbi:MAG: AAA family ATPase [Nannocystis sp.]|nr:ATP-binding protein [Nannocystis sp.]MBA3546698.1 AAA family ATPase [Nannocystis sp.]